MPKRDKAPKTEQGSSTPRREVPNWEDQREAEVLLYEEITDRIYAYASPKDWKKILVWRAMLKPILEGRFANGESVCHFLKHEVAPDLDTSFSTVYRTFHDELVPLIRRLMKEYHEE